MSDDTKAYHHFSVANEHFQKQQYHEAINEYSTALSFLMKFPRAHLFRGISHLNLKCYDEAIKDFSSTIEQIYSDSEGEGNFSNSSKEMLSRAFYMRAKAQRPQKKLQEALQDLNTSISMCSSSIHNQHQLSSMYMERALVNDYLEKYNDAICDYDKYLELVSSIQDKNYFLLFQANYNKSLALEQLAANGDPLSDSCQNYYHEALKCFDCAEQILKDHEQSHSLFGGNQHTYLSDLYFRRARILESLNLKEKAIQSYEECISIKNDHMKAHYQLAYLYYECNQFEKAINSFNIVLESDPKNDSNLFNRGMCFKSLQRWQEAVDDFKKTIQYNSGFNKAYIQLARSCRRLQDSNDTINDEETNSMILSYYNEAINRIESNNPQLPSLFFERGVVNNRLKKYKDAIEDFTRCISIDSNFADAYFNRGMIYHRELQQTKEAMDDYTRVLELDPNDLDCICERALLYFELGLKEIAEKNWRNVLELNPEHQLANHYIDFCTF